MSKILLTKPTLVMFYGYPGSGKTHLARQLAEQLNATHIESDRLRFELFEEPTFDAREELIVTNMMNFLSEELLKAGVSVFYDLNASRYTLRRELRELALKHKVVPVLTWVQIDVESAFGRVANRDRRKTDDKYARDQDRTTFDSVLGKMQNPTRAEEYVVVSGKHSFDAQRGAVVKKLYELGCLPVAEANSKVVKPGLVNLVPNAFGGRVDTSRRNITIS